MIAQSDRNIFFSLSSRFNRFTHTYSTHLQQVTVAYPLYLFGSIFLFIDNSNTKCLMRFFYLLLFVVLQDHTSSIGYYSKNARACFSYHPVRFCMDEYIAFITATYCIYVCLMMLSWPKVLGYYLLSSFYPKIYIVCVSIIDAK